SKQGHNDTGGAKTALGTVAIHHGLLDGMKGLALLQMFDGEELFAVQSADWGDTGIDGVITHPAGFNRAEHHRTSAAISRSAAFLGASQPKIGAQILQYGQTRFGVIQRYRLIVQQKTDHDQRSLQGYRSYSHAKCI